MPTAYKRGQQSEWVARGEKHYKSKLTESAVKEIRARHENGESMAKIAKSHGVCRYNIFAVVHRLTWKEI